MDGNSCRKALDNGRGRQYNETIQTIWNSYKLFVIPYSSPSEKCPMLRSGCLRLRQPNLFSNLFDPDAVVSHEEGRHGAKKSMLQQENRPCVKSAGPVFLSEKMRRASVLCPEDEV